ncbi:hypothetical protein [Flavobacterium adhaerens]|uniref:hypothetical protein n=1 Tax=Flavobacterium adhaerens TaxID=3149043 RepID=UPI0032B627AD
MNLPIIKTKRNLLLLALTTIVSFTSCQPEDSFADNGLTAESVDASFSITPVEGKVNTYKLVAQSKGVLKSLWDAGTGEFEGKMEEEVSLPDAGTYTITHVAIGAGGATATTSQEVVVTTSDPEKGNLVKGGSFLNAEDNANWTSCQINTNNTAYWTFNNGSATIHSTGGWAQEGIYQAIDVVKDKEYTIDMFVSSTQNSDETWFEVYAGKTVPTAGAEYKDNKVMGLSTWDGCAKTAFSGMLSKVGCVKNDVTKTVSNVVKFDVTGKVYLVIRSGGNSFTTSGITVSKIELRGK